MNTDHAFQLLRRANPVQTTHPGDRPDLVALITAQPGDPRLAGGRHRSSRRTLVAAVALVLTAIAASAAVAVTHWHTAPAVRPDVTGREYLAAQHSLTLPPGGVWPPFKPLPNSVTSQGGGASLAVTIAMHQWDCYWVDAVGRRDSAGAQRAQSTLEGLLAHNVIVAPDGAPEDWAPAAPPGVPYAIWADDGGYQYVKAAYADAASGKPQRLAQNCRANS